MYRSTRTEQERRQLQLVQLALAHAMMLASLAETEAAIGDPHAAERKAEAQSAYKKAIECALQASEEQQAFVEAQMRELRKALGKELS
jgi:hypothetical protein